MYMCIHINVCTRTGGIAANPFMYVCTHVYIYTCIHTFTPALVQPGKAADSDMLDEDYGGRESDVSTFVSSTIVNARF